VRQKNRVRSINGNKGKPKGAVRRLFSNDKLEVFGDIFKKQAMFKDIFVKIFAVRGFQLPRKKLEHNFNYEVM